jgi:uncharacterized ion transporter superfamily protein YfcC
MIYGFGGVAIICVFSLRFLTWYNNKVKKDKEQKEYVQQKAVKDFEMLCKMGEQKELEEQSKEQIEQGYIKPVEKKN